MFKGQERDLQGTKTANNRQRRQTGQTNARQNHQSGSDDIPSLRGTPSPRTPTLTLLDAKAAGPFVQGDVLVIVQVTGLEEACGAVFHGDEGSTQWGQLSVGQVPGRKERGRV